MSAGVQQGRCLWVAPIGYLNAKAAKGVPPELRIDSQRADLVRKAFELVASRSYTLEEVLRRINLLGLNTQESEFRVPTNPTFAVADVFRLFCSDFCC